MVSPRFSLALSSDFPSTVNPDLVAHIRTVSPNPRIAWVAPYTTAARLRFPLAKVAFHACGLKRLEQVVSDQVPREPARALERFDVVYLSGGDPLVFRQTLRRGAMAESVRNFAAAGRLVVAASGGAMQLTPNVSLYRLQSSDVDDVMANRDEFDGLALVGFELLPHFNRQNRTFLDKVRQYSERVPHDVVALDDGAAVLQESDGTIRCLGTGARYRDGVRSPLETTA